MAAIDLDLLTDFLMSPNSYTLRSHLLDVGVRSAVSATALSDRYSHEEVMRMIGNLTPPDAFLSTIVCREAGTLRFGRSLRLLGVQQPHALREAIEELQSVRASHQLLVALARSTQMCVLAKAVSEFIIIPSEEDLRLLLEDVERFGLKDVVALLIILSAVRYPSRREQESEPGDLESELAAEAAPN